MWLGTRRERLGLQMSLFISFLRGTEGLALVLPFRDLVVLACVA